MFSMSSVSSTIHVLRVLQAVLRVLHALRVLDVLHDRRICRVLPYGPCRVLTCVPTDRPHNPTGTATPSPTPSDTDPSPGPPPVSGTGRIGCDPTTHKLQCDCDGGTRTQSKTDRSSYPNGGLCNARTASGFLAPDTLSPFLPPRRRPPHLPRLCWLPRHGPRQEDPASPRQHRHAQARPLSGPASCRENHHGQSPRAQPGAV